MDGPSSAHFIYIPGILILGLVLGFIGGARLTRESLRLEARRAEEREAKKQERRQQREQQREHQGQDDKPPSPSGPEVKSGRGDKR
jgi:uncharacterized membrane-anchored protein YhcB (DUF1043 family)